MPELPDVMVYCEALAARISGARLEAVELANPFVLRTAVPSIAVQQPPSPVQDELQPDRQMMRGGVSFHRDVVKK